MTELTVVYWAVYCALAVMAGFVVAVFALAGAMAWQLYRATDDTRL